MNWRNWWQGIKPRKQEVYMVLCYILGMIILAYKWEMLK
jgi:hypothetical protein